jgi:hypothetical protein
LFRQLAYFIWLNESIARLASNCATLKRLLRGRITERVPRWSADTCPFWALRDVRGCAELERALKQRDALTASNIVVLPPGIVGGRIANQPGAVIAPAAARTRDDAARAAGHEPPARVFVGGQMQRTPVSERAAASNQPGAVVDPAAARARDAAARAAGHEPPARVVIGGLMQRRGGGRHGLPYEVRRVADGPDAPWQRHASGAAAFSAMGYGKRPGDRGELLGSAPLNRGWEVRAVGPAHSALEQQWACCDRCNKWRRVARLADVPGKDDKWFCEKLPGGSCDEPEDL